MSFVFVVDTNKAPLNPVHPGRARLLLKRGQAAVLKHYPFTLILKTAVESPQVQPLRLKIDPGSKTTGLAIVDDHNGQVLFAAELTHRGQEIKKALDSRRAVRKRRRARHTRYRKPKFNNRRRPRGWLALSLVGFLEKRQKTAKIECKSGFSNNSGVFSSLYCLLKDAFSPFSCDHPKNLLDHPKNLLVKGWLAPSLTSRVHNVVTWVHRLSSLCPIAAISMELVRFDMQAMEQPDIEGCQYQQGTLAGYEVRAYLLEKWERKCAYCSRQNLPLQVEHIVARTNGGTNRVSNLTLACEKCNQAKGSQDLAIFLKKKPEVLKKIQDQAKAPLKDAAAVNSTRLALFERLETLGLPLECGSGGLTKYNRVMRNLEKTHWLDASCVGASTPEVLLVSHIKPLLISANGHGCRQMCLMNDAGFPRTKPKAKHFPHEFRTGDMVRAVVPAHLNNAGVHRGRMSAKAKGGLTISTNRGKVTDIGKKYCRILQHADGYGYAYAA